MPRPRLSGEEQARKDALYMAEKHYHAFHTIKVNKVSKLILETLRDSPPRSHFINTIIDTVRSRYPQEEEGLTGPLLYQMQQEGLVKLGEGWRYDILPEGLRELEEGTYDNE